MRAWNARTRSNLVQRLGSKSGKFLSKNARTKRKRGAWKEKSPKHQPDGGEIALLFLDNKGIQGSTRKLWRCLLRVGPVLHQENVKHNNPSYAQELLREHPAIKQGLLYCLRWFWSGYDEHEEMSTEEERRQSRHACGWMGPERWGTHVSGVEWYGSMWLVDDEIEDGDVVEKRKQLPRVVAHPRFYGSPRYDFVKVLVDKEGASFECQ
jgi:hypothetical protein